MKTNPFLLVLGMHRSGTSALAGIIDQLGFDAGSHVLVPQADNPKGFWENAKVVDAHDAILRSLGSSWDDPVTLNFGQYGEAVKQQYSDSLKKLLIEEFGEADKPYIKDPRLCQFIELWLPLLNELEWQPKCLIIVRNPFEVAESLRKRNDMDIDSALLIWLKCNLNIECQTRGISRCLLSYEGLLENPSEQIRRVMSSLEYSSFEDGQIENSVAYIDRAEQHNYWSELPGNQSGVYSQMSKDVYNVLLSLAKPDAKAETRVLDQCRKTLEEHEALSFPWIKSGKRVSDNAVLFVRNKIEDAYQTLINENVSAELPDKFNESVSNSLVRIDELVEAVTEKVISCDNRVRISERKADEIESDYKDCKSELIQYEARPLRSFFRVAAIRIINKFNREK